MKYITLVCVLAFACVLAAAYPQENQVQQPSENIARLPRSHHHHDHHHHHHHHDAVDFGAHTGEHGSFGWYADFPVHHHH